MFTKPTRSANAGRLCRVALGVATTLALLPGVAFSCPCADARCLPMCRGNAAADLYPSDPPVIRG